MRKLARREEKASLRTAGFALVVALAAACSGSTSSGSGGGSGGGAGGGSAGGSGGGSGGGNAGSAGGGNAGGAGGGNAGGAGGGSGGATALIGGLSEVRGLTVSGGNLYWINGRMSSTGAIQSIPITGASSANTVYSSAQLLGDLASDGTNLYFDANDATLTNYTDMDAVSLQGGNEQTLGSGVAVMPHDGDESELFILGSTLYFPAESEATGDYTAWSLPVTGGTPAEVVTGLNAASSGNINDLLAVDSTGIFLFYQTVSPQQSQFGYAALAGGPPSPLYVTSGTASGFGGMLAVVNGTAWFFVNTGITNSAPAMLYKATPPSGPGTLVATYTSAIGVALVGDANGLYAIANGDGAGVYSINLSTGAPTLIPTNIASGGALNDAALDANNIYFTAAAASKKTIYSVPR